MLGAELNAAIQEEFPAPATHAHRLRNWLVWRARAVTQPNSAPDPAQERRDVATAEPPR
jgi:membrane protein